MKFLLIVLTIHLAAEFVTGRGKEKNGKEGDGKNRVAHPAEFELRG